MFGRALVLVTSNKVLLRRTSPIDSKLPLASMLYVCAPLSTAPRLLKVLMAYGGMGFLRFSFILTALLVHAMKQKPRFFRKIAALMSW